MSHENANECEILKYGLPKCTKATTEFIRAVGKHAKEDAFGEHVIEMVNYDFYYKKASENPLVERVEIEEKSDCKGDLLPRKKSFIVGTDLKENIWSLIVNYGLNFRICDECGKPIEEGYYNEDAELYACCDGCFKKQMNRTYKDGWKMEVKGDTYYAFYDMKEGWNDITVYYTEWY